MKATYNLLSAFYNFKNPDNAWHRRLLWAIPALLLASGIFFLHWRRQRRIEKLDEKAQHYERKALRLQSLVEELPQQSDAQKAAIDAYMSKAAELRDSSDALVTQYLEADVNLRSLSDWETLKEAYEALD